MTRAGVLLGHLVDELTASGKLTPPWREAFGAVPRHVFIPDLVWREDPGVGGPVDLVPLRRAEDPEGWLELAYGNDFVITQVDDGCPVGPGLLGSCATSSGRMPAVVAEMLDQLGVEPGMRVLEIGTGTGYNAALLAHRLGAERVTTVEIDADLAGQARAALAATGFGAVTVITGDGALGHAPRAPYDRVISTANVNRVPPAWIAQTRSGGRVLTPWGTPYYTGGLLSLTVAEDGTARGSLVGQTCFMDLRDQRSPRVSVRRCVHDEDQAVVTSTELHPYEVAGHYDVNIGIGIQVPRCKHLYQPAEDGSGEAVLWFLDPWSGSWASLHHDPQTAAGSYRVRQFGPRHLWDEVEAAYRWWRDASSPRADQWTYTVTPAGQQISLPHCAPVPLR